MLGNELIAKALAKYQFQDSLYEKNHLYLSDGIENITSKIFEEDQFGLKNLESLEIEDTFITEIPKEISSLKNLRKIVLLGNKNLTRIHPEVLNTMPNLEVYVDNCCKLPDSEKPKNAIQWESTLGTPAKHGKEFEKCEQHIPKMQRANTIQKRY